jgi:hypothetical protein
VKRLAAILLLLLFHFALVRALGSADFMGALAAARHGHVAMAASFALLLMVRLTTIVLLPGFVFASIIRIFDSFSRSNKE